MIKKTFKRNKYSGTRVTKDLGKFSLFHAVISKKALANDRKAVRYWRLTIFYIIFFLLSKLVLMAGTIFLEILFYAFQKGVENLKIEPIFVEKSNGAEQEIFASAISQCLERKMSVSHECVSLDN